MEKPKTNETREESFKNIDFTVALKIIREWRYFMWMLTEKETNKLNIKKNLNDYNLLNWNRMVPKFCLNI